MWFGLNFANRFVAPIRRLINAADQVASGNYYAQVPFRKTEGDLQHLGESFNKMTQELSRQRTTLIEQSEQIDSRRRFTEAVLAGVPAGIIGVDGRGVITIANPSVERMLGRSVADLVGEPLEAVMPELGGLPGDTRARPTQQQIQIARNGRERTIDVRTTSEQSQDGDRGYVVTLDDITDLVTAQRTSAWPTSPAASPTRSRTRSPRSSSRPSASGASTGRSSPPTRRSSSSASPRSCARSTTSSGWWTSSRPSPGCPSPRSPATT